MSSNITNYLRIAIRRSVFALIFIFISCNIVFAQSKWFNENSTYIKLKVGADDIYRIYGEDFKNLGINLSTVNSATIKIFYHGEQIPIYVKDNGNSFFEENDYIEFICYRNYGGKHREVAQYNHPYNEFLNRYTDSTTYFINWGGEPGLHINSESYETNNNIIDYYYSIIHLEQNNVFDYSVDNLVRKELPDWIENETWSQGLLNAGGKISHNFSCSDIIKDKPFYFYAKLQSFATDLQTNSHLVALGINNQNMYYDSTYVNKANQAVLNSSDNSNILKEGTNSIQIYSFPTGGLLNSTLFDWFEIEYPRKINLVHDSLSFRLIGINEPKTLLVNNITSNNYSVWVITDSLKKLLVIPEGNQIQFSIKPADSTKVFIKSESKINKPRIVGITSFKDYLLENSKSYQYLIITAKPFIQKSQEYSDFILDKYRKSVRVIDVEDIYDQFSYGEFNPESIRNFILYVSKNWASPKIEYLLLIGSATHDYYGNRHFNGGFPEVINYVPSFGAPVSDSWFGIIDSISLTPEIKIGRLPIQNIEEYERYFQRHRNYLSSVYTDWNKRFLFFSGGKGDSQVELDKLKNANDFVIDSLVTPPPIGAEYFHFYKTIFPLTNFGNYAPEYVSEKIQDGGIFISYIGHSGTRTWDNTITEPSQLKNRYDKASLITDFGCVTAKFAEPDVTSFAELMTIGENSSAISYIGNSSAGFISTAIEAPKLFYSFLLNDSLHSVSSALIKTKSELIKNSGFSEIAKLFSLTSTIIGDPIIGLRIPDKPNLKVERIASDIDLNNISEFQDSIKFVLVYKNMGLAISDSFRLSFTYKYISEITKTFTLAIPALRDSITIFIPIKNNPGKYSLSFNLDSSNKIDEFNENDNSFEYQFIVNMSNFLPIMPYSYENCVSDTIYFINPQISTNDKPLYYIAPNPNFTNHKIYNFYKGLPFTKVPLNDFTNEERYWIKVVNREYTSPVYSFTKTDKYDFLVGDSIGFEKQQLSNLSYNNNLLVLKNKEIKLVVKSAGFHDGRSSLILKNDTNYVPENYKVGHHLAIFNKQDLRFINYYYFNTYSGGIEVINSYKKLLDTISSSYIVAFSISDDGRITDQELIAKIKSFGSTYIDKLKFRGSWAMIGWKNAAQSEVKENYSSPAEGAIEISSNYLRKSQNGTLKTIDIGPAASWKSFEINSNLSNENNTKNYLLGKNNNNLYDTLKTFSAESILDLSLIDAKKYPFIKFVSEMKSDGTTTTPEIKFIAANYESVPELAFDNTFIEFLIDSLTIINGNSYSVRIFNHGESKAENVLVKCSVLDVNGKVVGIFDDTVLSIPPHSARMSVFSIYLPSIQAGNKTLFFEIDPKNKITELYEDNNSLMKDVYFYSEPLKIRLDLKIDENEIYDGDYVSSSPNVNLKIYEQYNAIAGDTSLITLKLNKKRIYLNDSRIKYEFLTFPSIAIDFKPTLDDGEYLLEFTLKEDHLVNSKEWVLIRNFKVTNSLEIHNVYNYPNPFSDATYFTFKLTQIPDEMLINIFTLTGRKIREIKLSGSDLQNDFNRIYWDGKDEDGEVLANGVYLYKLISIKDNKSVTSINKLAIVR